MHELQTLPEGVVDLAEERKRQEIMTARQSDVYSYTITVQEIPGLEEPFMVELPNSLGGTTLQFFEERNGIEEAMESWIWARLLFLTNHLDSEKIPLDEIPKDLTHIEGNRYVDQHGGEIEVITLTIQL